MDLILGIAGHRNLIFFTHGEEYQYFVENRLDFRLYIQILEYRKRNQNILAYKKNIKAANFWNLAYTGLTRKKILWILQ